MKGAIFVILVGPGEKEKQRLYDFLATLLFFEKEVLARSTLLLVNDCNLSLDHGDVAARFKCRQVVCLDNPYSGRVGGELVYDRLTAGIWAALARVIELEEPHFVLKADTDALVCGPFATRLEEYFRKNPRVGMLGSVVHHPDGTRRNTEEWWANWIRSTCGPLPHQWLRLLRRGRTPLKWRDEWCRWRARLALYRRALSADWSCGTNILGGAYALSPAALRQLREKRVWWEDRFMFNGTRMSEDVALSMLIAALGLPLAEYNRPGEVFAIWYQKPSLPMREIIERGYGLVHSIKDPVPDVELEMRLGLANLVGIPEEFRTATGSFRGIPM